MNYIVLILGVILVVIIVIVCIILYINHRKKIKDLNVDILNSVYGSDGYYMHYVPLIEIFKSLVSIANYDSNYTQIEDENEYKLVVICKDNLNYITCSIVDNNQNILAGSDFETQYMDIDEFYGQTMSKNISTNLLNIGHYKNIIFDITNNTSEIKNNSWTGTKNIEINSKTELPFKYTKTDNELITINN